MAGDVFNDHDGIVHDESRGDGERHERQIVEAIVAEIHDAEGTDQRERHGHAGNDGGPDVSQKGKNNEDDQQDGNAEGDFDVADRRANGGSAIDGNGEMQRRRNRGAQQGKEGHDAVDGIDHVGARLTEDGHQDTALAVGEAQVARIFDGVDDFRDVAQAHGSALMSGND